MATRIDCRTNEVFKAVLVEVVDIADTLNVFPKDRTIIAVGSNGTEFILGYLKARRLNLDNIDVYDL